MTRRIPISDPVDVHSAAPMLLAANRASPTTSVPRRPNLSPIVPPASTRAANAKL